MQADKKIVVTTSMMIIQPNEFKKNNSLNLNKLLLHIFKRYPHPLKGGADRFAI